MGQRIATYTVTDTLGRGGDGEVFAAVHDVIGREVAIEVLHTKWSDDRASRRHAENVLVPRDCERESKLIEIGLANLAAIGLADASPRSVR